MAIEFIPNQPIIFEADDQPCKNNDSKQYNMLLQAGDRLHFQFKNDPCGDELLCTPNTLGTDIITNSGWDGSTTGWVLDSEWTFEAVAPNTVTVNSTGSAVIYQPLANMVASPQLGNPYRVVIYVTQYVSGILSVFLGNTLVGKVSSAGSHIFYVTPSLVGDFVLQNDHDDLAGYHPIEMTLSATTINPIMECVANWDDQYRSVQLVQNSQFTGNADGWTLENGWSYNTNKITKTPGTAGNAYQIVDTVQHRQGYTLVITTTGRTAGTLTVDFGNVTVATITSNTTTTVEYSLPAIFDGQFANNQLSLYADASFDGSVTVAEINYNESIVKYTADGFCKTVTDIDTYLDIAPTVNYTAISRLQASIRGYNSGSVRFYYDTFTTFLEGVEKTGNGDYDIYLSPPSSASRLDVYFSTDFVGCIESLSLKQLAMNHELAIFNVDGSTPATDFYDSASSQDPLVYHDNYVTWSIDLNDVLYGGIAEQVPDGCYIVKMYDGCADDYKYSETVISYSTTDLPCTEMVEASCTNNNLGFDFSQGFKIAHRLKVLRISPKYRIKGEEYVYSTGRNNLYSADTDKVWICWFNYADERTHDAIAAQILCDTITIGSVDYYAVPQDYEPEWAQNMKRNLAQSRIELKKKTSKLYKRNIA